MMTDAAGEAFRRHYGEVYRYLLARTGDHAQAEELAQRVFLDAVLAEPQLAQTRTPAVPWLLTVAHRRWVDERRRSSRVKTLVERLGRARAGTAVQSDDELAAALHRALDGLAAGQRQVVVRRLLRGQSFADIAMDLHTSEGAVKMRFHRGIENVRQALEEEGLRP